MQLAVVWLCHQSLVCSQQCLWKQTKECPRCCYCLFVSIPPLKPWGLPSAGWDSHISMGFLSHLYVTFILVATDGDLSQVWKCDGRKTNVCHEGLHLYGDKKCLLSRIPSLWWRHPPSEGRAPHCWKKSRRMFPWRNSSSAPLGRKRKKQKKSRMTRQFWSTWHHRWEVN